MVALRSCIVLTDIVLYVHDKDNVSVRNQVHAQAQIF